MAKQLISQPLSNFGVNGLNTQSNPNSLDPSYLTTADNIVLRESGRISFRKGLKQKVVPSGTSINSIVEHNDQGTNKIFASYGTSIYTMDFTTPETAFPSSGDDVKHTVSGTTGDWQFVNFNDRLHCFHSGVVPQRYDGSYPSNEKWSSSYHTDAINLANGSTITAPNVVKDTTYKITALGNTSWSLLREDTNKEAEVGDIFIAVDTGSTATSTSATAPNMVSGNRYKIIALGDTDFNLNGADASPAVGEIFTANDVLGIGTGLVAEVISGSTGTAVEIKTNSTLTTITVDDTTNFPSTGKIIIDEEIISYTGKTSTTFTGCIRGSSNTTATYHLDNAVVKNDFSPLSVTEGEFKPSCGTGAYGRIWAGGVEEEKDVLHYSSILDGDDFTLYSGGGSIDLKKVWDKDDIIAIAPFYGQLAVFGKNNIAIYESPDVIGNIKLNEVIKGVGCIARDSVQAVGDDLLFMSATGLRSLARTSEKDKVPLMDLSINIKDTMIRNIGQSTNVKSVYVENEGIYIVSFVDKNINYVFDFKHFTPNGVPRVTTWTFDEDREPSSMVYTELYSGLLVGQKDGGIAGYEGYFDADYQPVVVETSAFSVAHSSSSSTGGWPEHSIVEKKIGTSSIYFEPNPENLIATSQSKFNIGTSNFTVEAWIKPSTEGSAAGWGTGTEGEASSARNLVFEKLDGSVGFLISWSTDFITLHADTVAPVGTPTATSTYHGLVEDAWAHIAVTRTGTEIEFWVNGVSKGTGTYAGNLVDAGNWNANTFKISSGTGMVGYMDEIRFSKIARYSSTFTPSTTEFISDADTLLLIHSNESQTGSLTFVDSSADPISTYLKASYSTDISSPWLGLGETMADSILKKAHFVLEGGSGSTLGLKIYKDFGTDANEYSINLSPTSTGTTSLWGEALYGTSKYSPIYGLQEYKENLSGSAKHLKINMAIDSQGYDVSLQDLSILHKQGKIR